MTRGSRGRALPQLLAEHRRALGECRACGLGTPRPILSEAHEPRVMLVGQAPGKVEELGGRPFSGRAGRTLFRWLETAGVSEETARRDIYIAAITRCYPGPATSGRGDRVASTAERERCAGWLDAELAIIRPRLVIAVGRLAIDRFLGTAPLDELVGKVHAVRDGRVTIRVLPLPHPSGASGWFHIPGNRALLDSALGVLAGELRAAGIRTTERAMGAA